MTAPAPVAELDPDFSTPGARPIAWSEAERQLREAGVFWLSTVRPEGRPHVAPLIAVWLDGALYFCTGANERKARNLAENALVSVTTGVNTLIEGADIVVEGEAAVVTEDAKISRVGDAFAAKYGDAWRLPGHEGVVVFEVTPVRAFGFAREDAKGPPPIGTFSQTRWRFQAEKKQREGMVVSR